MLKRRFHSDDEKKQNKLQRQIERFENNKFIKFNYLIFKYLLILLTVLFLIFITKIGLNLYDDYNNSVKWTKITGPKLAEQDPELLYASDNDKSNRLKVTELMVDIWDSNAGLLKSNISQSKIDDLTYFYKKLKNPGDKLSAEYNTIIDFWNVNIILSELYVKNSDVIKADITTQKISDNIDEAWLIVSNYLINDKNYKQAEIYRDQIYDLAEDASRYTELLINFNSKYKITISSNKLNIKSAIFTNELNDLKSNVNNLKLKYELVNNFIKPILNSSIETAKSNDNNKNLYNQYTNDIRLKSEFENYIIKYNSTVKTINDNIINYEDFIGKSLDEITNWANTNGITLIINHIDSDKKINTVISQTPSYGDYKKVQKGSSITITVSRGQVVTTSTTSTTSTTINNTTEPSTTDE
jgi:hypothetical protein